MRYQRLAPLLLLSFLIGCRQSQPAASQPTREPSTRVPLATTRPAGPVAAVWYDIGYPPPGVVLNESRRLIVGVWGDGRVVWSDDHVKGGGPYRAARVEPARVEQLLRDLHAAGFFDEKRTVNFGPDASYTVLAAADGSQRQWLGSWHDPAPANPNVFIGEGGMSAVEPGKPRPQHSPEYAKFLKTWAESRRLIEQIAPQGGGEPLPALDLAIFNVGRESK